MATECVAITCSTGCENELPEVAFSICAPVTNFGQIAKVYIGNDGYPLTDETVLTEWQTRANLPSNAPSRILELSVIGDKPLAAGTKIPLSRGRTITGTKDHVVNVKIDETNDTNYEMMRAFECGNTVRVWYETFGGKLYGGTTGVLGSVTLGEVIPENPYGLTVSQGTVEWKSKFSPCRTDSPMAGINLVDEGGVS